MACKCIEVIDAELAKCNSRLDVGFTFGTPERPGYAFPALNTEKINKRNRDRMGVIPTFCPFCGVAYRAEADADAAASTRRDGPVLREGV
jgi:hypothetical protein